MSHIIRYNYVDKLLRNKIQFKMYCIVCNEVRIPKDELTATKLVDWLYVYQILTRL